MPHRINQQLSMPSLFPFYLSPQKPVLRGFIADNKRLRRRFSHSLIAKPENRKVHQWNSQIYYLGLGLLIKWKFFCKFLGDSKHFWNKQESLGNAMRHTSGTHPAPWHNLLMTSLAFKLAFTRETLNGTRRDTLKWITLNFAITSGRLAMTRMCSRRIVCDILNLIKYVNVVTSLQRYH